jgi:MoaA/NifB/PqqE/SkfB family radical SAM enzyme
MDDIRQDIIKFVNDSYFLKLVISGGEPFENNTIGDILPQIDHLKKAIVIDTNGTHEFQPSEIELIRRKNITLRISLDSVNPNENEKIRTCPSGPYFERIVANIELLIKSGINIALQTVVTKSNIKSLTQLAAMISHWDIKKWYLQPMIPSGRGKFMEHLVPTHLSIIKECLKLGLDEGILLLKEDENHKAVVLLNNYGDLITEDSNENILLGTICNIKHNDLISKIDKANHIKRYKIESRCLCEK